MSDEKDLKDLALKARREFDDNSKPAVPSPTEADPDDADDMMDAESIENADFDTDDDDDEDSPFIGGLSSFDGSDDDDEEEDDDLSSDFSITDDDLKAEMPDLDDPAFLEASSKIRTEIETYRKNLILRNGFTIEEANEAARNRVHHLGKQENDAFLEEHPNLGIIEIDKKNVDKVEFTEEERSKMTKVKALQLKIVENVDLKTLPVKKLDKKHKSAFIQSMDSNLSHYSVPLPLTHDFARFKGAQIIQLMQAVKYEDSTLDEILARKASLLYNQFVGGTHLKKYDESGKVILSYQDFINTYKYHDVDLGLFGILVASSMENITTDLRCSHCETPFQWEYNMKKLLNLDDIPDVFKEMIDGILGHKTDAEFLKKGFDKNDLSVRVKSPITGNVYELNYPSIARAINFFKIIDQTDETMVYLSAFALFISKMYIIDRKTGEYVEILEDEYRELLEALQLIPQEEIDIIQAFLKDRVYTPKFQLKSKCPTCGNDMTNELSVDDLVFLKAQDSSTEIR